MRDVRTQGTRHHHCECGCGVNRRGFLKGMGLAAGGLVVGAGGCATVQAVDPEFPVERQLSLRKRRGATVRAAFLYPPSETFSKKPDGWWSWPGTDFDAEGRQRQFVEGFRRMEERLGVKILVEERPVARAADAAALAGRLSEDPPDGLLLVMFYNRSLKLADQLLDAAAKAGMPAIFYVGLGVKHGPVAHYRRPGVYFIQSLDNLAAIERGLRMVNARALMRQSVLLSIVEAKEEREGIEKFFGTTLRVIPFRRYADTFRNVKVNAEANEFLSAVTAGASEQRGITQESLQNAMRAHFALKRLLSEEQADGLTMNCLRRGMLKPCLSFAVLNGSLIPAACENDRPALYTQLLGQLLTGRPGFQHNPAFETERNHYYASHCTCPPKICGPDGRVLPFMLRRFFHTNEGSCAIQVFWREGDPVTMMRYRPGEEPALDVYAGTVVKSHPMPPAGGCTTNVEVRITDRADACMVKGHHNLLFCGDYARTFRLFARLHRMRLADTGYAGPPA